MWVLCVGCMGFHARENGLGACALASEQEHAPGLASHGLAMCPLDLGVALDSTW